MLYGITSFFISLLLWGFITVIGYFMFLDFQHVDLKNNIEMYLPFLYFLLVLITIERLIFYIRFWKYIVMPYSLNFNNMFKNRDNTRQLHIDRFLEIQNVKPKSVIEQIRTKDLKRFKIIYRNFEAINLENYRQSGEAILHYLNLINDKYEVKVHNHKNKHVKLSFYKLPLSYEIDFTYFKSGKIFLGLHEDGLYYRRLEALDHYLIVGESGSGKSNFMHLSNMNFLLNYHHFNKLYMIDLKGGVELKQYEHIDKVEFVSDIQKLDTFLDTVLADLKESHELMLKTNQRKLNDYTLIIFDEIGAISTYPDKKLREYIFDKLALISMQGRASGILLFLFAQKIDNTILPSTIVNNLQSRVLLKTSNDYNINIIDLKENIRERITATEVQDFNKGRAIYIYKDGLTSEKHLIQFPYINDNFLNSILKLNHKNISFSLSSL